MADRPPLTLVATTPEPGASYAVYCARCGGRLVHLATPEERDWTWYHVPCPGERLRLPERRDDA